MSQLTHSQASTRAQHGVPLLHECLQACGLPGPSTRELFRLRCCRKAHFKVSLRQCNARGGEQLGNGSAVARLQVVHLNANEVQSCATGA